MVINQCIVFDLPSGAGGMAAGMYKGNLIKELNNFCATHNIDYVAKSQRYEYKIWFNNTSHYTLFILGFSWRGVWRHPRLKDENYEP